MLAIDNDVLLQCPGARPAGIPLLRADMCEAVAARWAIVATLVQPFNSNSLAHHEKRDPGSNFDDLSYSLVTDYLVIRTPAIQCAEF